jgi:hypothetical protein
MRSRSDLALVLGALALGGCSISGSISNSVESASESVSKSGESISDSSRSFSDSSGGGGSSELAGREGLRRDLRAYGVAYVEGDAGPDEFLRGVGRVARGHGVTHWESSPAVLVAVGEGLRDAEVPESLVRDRLAGVEPRARALVLAPLERRAE